MARRLVCPACQGTLGGTLPPSNCTECGRRYGSVAGIPDLRLTPDLEDVQRAQALHQQFDQFDFAGLLQAGVIPRTPALRSRLIRCNLGYERTSSVYVDCLEEARGKRLGPDDDVLEIGCGTGPLAVVSASRGARTVASDISMRALILAKKRLRERDAGDVELVCCHGEELPFAPNSFDIVVASDVIEHTSRQQEFVQSCWRVLAPGGVLFLVVPNRFSLSIEPHVRLWGVGFLSRGLARRYVAAFRGAPYDDVHPISMFRLRRLLAAAGFRARFTVPEIPVPTQELYRGIELRVIRFYNRLRTLRALRPLLLTVGPFWHVFGWK
jgi:SAM-dependent methyltransferase